MTDTESRAAFFAIHGYVTTTATFFAVWGLSRSAMIALVASGGCLLHGAAMFVAGRWRERADLRFSPAEETR